MTKLYQVRDPQNSEKIVMIAPMDTIRQAFGLHKDAVNRILLETNDQYGISSCHFNGKPTSVNTSGSILIARFDEARVK